MATGVERLEDRAADLRRIYDLRDRDRIDGLYTLNTLGDFRTDLEAAARRLGLIQEPA